MNRLEAALQNVRQIPEIKPIDKYPRIPFYADKDGCWYLYTIYHLEQIIETMGSSI